MHQLSKPVAYFSLRTVTFQKASAATVPSVTNLEGHGASRRTSTLSYLKYVLTHTSTSDDHIFICRYVVKVSETTDVKYVPPFIAFVKGALETSDHPPASWSRTNVSRVTLREPSFQTR